ncbi:MAG: S8 family serine peptidase, partial [Cyanobacteria bacterium P01_D01_bin.116]
MATFNIFSSIEEYNNALGINPVSTQDFESFANGTDLDGVEFISGISATSNLPRVEVFQGSEDKELFILDRRSVSDDSFYEINFSESYNAVGFDIEAFNPVTPGPAVLDIEFADGESTSVEIFPTNPTESDPIFFGIVADKPIAKIRLTEGPEVNGIGNEEIALDNFIVANIPDSSQQQEIESSFEIDSPNSVPYKIFNVLVPGTIEVEIELEEGNSEELTVSLEGKRRPELDDPTAPYAQVSGSSSLTLTYEVTEEDIERGVSWRLVVDSEGNEGFKGNIKITTPFDAEVDQIFQQQKISLRSGDLLPTGLEDEFLDELEIVDDATDERLEGLHGIITVNRTPEHDELLKLEKAGINRQSFLPNKHAFGFVDRDVDFSDPNIARLVRSFTPLEPEDKIAPDILVGNYQKYFVDEINENYVLNDDGSLSLSVLFARDTSLEDIRSILEQETIEFSPLTDYLWEVDIEAENLIDLATYDRVEWIDPIALPALPDNDNSRVIINVDAVQNPQVDALGNLILTGGNPVYDGLTGNGITVGVDDNGIDASHPDLNVTADRLASNVHGTHVAGTIAGRGFQSSNNDANGNPNGGTPFEWRGIAPSAALIDSGNLNNAGNLLSAIQSNSLDLFSQSETISLDGDYDGTNLVIDQLLRGGATSDGIPVPRRPKTDSASNNGGNTPQRGNQNGYYSLGKQVKNSIVVGSVSDATTLSGFSSMGPAYDGRIKPDVVALGTRVNSTVTNRNEQQDITLNGGTPTSGTFTLTFQGNTTNPIAFNASAGTIQTALTALPNINPGDVSVTGGPFSNNMAALARITFTGALGNINLPTVGISGTGLDAGITAAITTNTNGATSNGYESLSGTSMSTPAVAGVVALMLEGWQNTYSTPLGTTIDERPPLPSTLRALLIQTAEDIVENDVRGATLNEIDSDSNPINGNDGLGRVTATVGPDYATGWGLVDAEAAVELMQ